MTEVDLRILAPRDRYKLAIGSVIPRPIAWVSTCDGNGTRNLAPFSFFTVVCEAPLIFSIFVMRYKTGEEMKDTAKNLLETEEAVIHIVPFSLAHQMNVTSASLPASVDEFELAGVTAEPSLRVKPDRIAEAPIAFECVLHKHVTVGEEQGGADAFFLEAVHARFHDGVMDDFRIDHYRLNPLARLAGNWYSGLGNEEAETLFEMKRPSP